MDQVKTVVESYCATKKCILIITLQTLILSQIINLVIQTFNYLYLHLQP